MLHFCLIFLSDIFNMMIFPALSEFFGSSSCWVSSRVSPWYPVSDQAVAQISLDEEVPGLQAFRGAILGCWGWAGYQGPSGEIV